MPVGSRIARVGHYQPARELANTELAATIDTTDEWIRERVGVISRRIAGPDETVTDMAIAAAEKTVAEANLPDIDLVVVATSTSLDRMPSTAARVARALGLAAPAAFDLNAACSGFSYALATADHAIAAGAARSALVIGADKMSEFLDWTDRSTCVIFGDGAGAAVLAADDDPGIGPVVWGTKPAMAGAVTIEGPGGPQARRLFAQQGQSVYRWATTELAPIARQACVRAGVEPRDLAAFVPHQANIRIIGAVARQLNVPGMLVAQDIVESGNTNAASIPIALSKLVQRREIPPGAPVLLLGFGSGLAYSAQVVRLP
jgi:3-oxoacyl-[acyl-carrier-protein] synthase III